MGKPCSFWPKSPGDVAVSRRADAQRGFSLLDVLIATMLLGVVGVVVFTAFAIGLRAAALAGGMNTAVSLAEETLTALAA